MDKGTKESLTIMRLPNGGYVVADGWSEPGNLRMELLACTTVDEALDFIKHVIEPVKPQQSNVADILYGNRDKGFGGSCPA